MTPPAIVGLLETALYVEDMARSAEFFRDVLGLSIMVDDDRLTAFDAGHGGVLLLFPRGGATRDVTTDAGLIPGHDGRGPLHMALAIGDDAYLAWLDHLAAAGVTMRGTMRWPRGAEASISRTPMAMSSNSPRLACGRTTRRALQANAAASQAGTIASPKSSTRRCSTIRPSLG